MIVTDRTVPTAHVAESNPARYLALTNARDSHSYTGLQIPVYFEPLEDDFTHQDSNTQPIRRQDFNTQPIRGQDSNKQPIRGQDSNTQPIRGQDSNTQPIRGQDSNTQPIRGQDSNSQPIRAKKPVFVINVPNQELRKQIMKINHEKQQYKWNSQS
jgi:hypothetical protein